MPLRGDFQLERPQLFVKGILEPHPKMTLSNGLRWTCIRQMIFLEMFSPYCDTPWKNV